MVIGDLDSLRPYVEDYYRSQGVHVERDGDQYSTDFGKAMKVLTHVYAHLENTPLSPPSPVEDFPQDIIVLCSIAGRLDQGIGLLHELYRESLRNPPSSKNPVRLWLLSEQNISFLIHPGTNTISGIDPKVDQMFHRLVLKMQTCKLTTRL